MRKALTVCFAGISAFSGTVSAQSSVTLYGSIDNGVSYISDIGGKPLWRLHDGINKSNSLGIAGAEDLGGGRKALFRVESGFSASTGVLGQGGLIFGKQAFVGVAGSAGQLTFGRQYDFTTLLAKSLPCMQCGIYGVQNADLDRVSGQRLNNSIQYQSANWSGFKTGAMYALGETAPGATNRGRAVSASVEYAAGPVLLQLVATDINGAPVLSGVLGTRTFLGTSTTTTPAVYVDKQRIIGAGVSWTAGPWHFASLLTRTQLTLGAQSGTDRVLHLGADYRITPSLLVLGKVTSDRFEDSRWTGLNLGLNYQISRRTDLYLDLATQKASGAGTRASIALVGPSSDDRQTVTRVGIKHLF